MLTEPRRSESTEPVRVGLVGFGGVGRMHAACYAATAADAVLAAIVDVDPSARHRASVHFPQAKVFASVDEMLHEQAVHVVDCSVDTPQHESVIEQALLAQLPAICEKPLTAKADASQRLAELSKTAGVPVAMNFNLRFVPALTALRDRIRAGELGSIVSFEFRYHRSSRVSGRRATAAGLVGEHNGALVDLGPHVIDLVRFLLGEIEEVHAWSHPVDRAHSLSPPGVEGARLFCRIAGGAVGSIDVSKSVPGAQNAMRIEAFGTQGRFAFDLDDPNALWMYDTRELGPGIRKELVSRGGDMTVPPGDTPTSWHQWHGLSLAAFLHAVRTGDARGATMADGLAVDRVLDAARKSISTRTAITITEFGATPWVRPLDRKTPTNEPSVQQ